MRKKTLQLLVTFPTTTAAIAMESRALEEALPGRIVPLPSEISAGCGLAWKTSLGEKPNIMDWLQQNSLRWEMMYEVELY